MFAANEQRIIFKAGNEDDAPIFFQGQLIRALGPSQNVIPFCLVYLIGVEKFVIASDYNLRSAVFVSCGKVTY